MQRISPQFARSSLAELAAVAAERTISAAIATAMFQSGMNEGREPTTSEILAEVDAIRDLCHTLIHDGDAQQMRIDCTDRTLKPWLKKWKASAPSEKC